MTKIALFGTSADPPTAGHQTILRWLADRYDLVAVWASDNPFKQHQTSLEHRTQMLRLTIEEIETVKDNIRVYEELSDRRSLITVDRAREIWGEKTEFSLVIGSDLIRQIRSWYRIEELLDKTKLLIVPRPGYSIKTEDLFALENLGGKYSIANLEMPAISSTDYRQARDFKVITPAVTNYIKRQKLYA